MTIFAPRWARLAFSVGVVLAALQVVNVVNNLFQAEAGAVPWLELLAAVYCCTFFGWLTYLTVFLPVVRIDGHLIAWRAMVGTEFQAVSVREVVGCRFQDTFDLRLQLRSGDERSIHLSQVNKKDRSRLAAAIEEIAGDGVPA